MKNTVLWTVAFNPVKIKLAEVQNSICCSSAALKVKLLHKRQQGQAFQCLPPLSSLKCKYCKHSRSESGSVGRRRVGLEAVRDAAGDASRGGIRGEILATARVSFSRVFSPAVCFCEDLLRCVVAVRQIIGGKTNHQIKPPSLKGFCSCFQRVPEMRRMFPCSRCCCCHL